MWKCHAEVGRTEWQEKEGMTGREINWLILVLQKKKKRKQMSNFRMKFQMCRSTPFCYFQNLLSRDWNAMQNLIQYDMASNNVSLS